MQARLPKDLEEDTLEEMKDGQRAFTVHWAMYADEQGLLWLNGSYPAHTQPGGTVSMLVTKKNGEYTVHLSSKEKQWKPGSGSYVGKFTPLPVKELIR